jgi:hypothetical protein
MEVTPDKQVEARYVQNTRLVPLIFSKYFFGNWRRGNRERFKKYYRHMGEDEARTVAR